MVEFVRGSGPKALLVYLLCSCIAFAAVFGVYKMLFSPGDETSSESSAEKTSEAKQTEALEAVTILDTEGFPAPKVASLFVSSQETSALAAIAAIENNVPLLIIAPEELEQAENKISAMEASQVIIFHETGEAASWTGVAESYDREVIAIDCDVQRIPCVFAENSQFLQLLAKEKVTNEYQEIVGVDFAAISDAALPLAKPTNAAVVLGELSDTLTLESITAAHASGNEVLLLPEGLRFSSSLADTLRKDSSKRLLFVGTNFEKSSLAEVEVEIEAVKKMATLPGGGQTILYTDDSNERRKRFIALYGSPQGGALGVLGEQNTEETIVRAKELAAEYQELEPETEVIPTLEIIVTVAAETATEDNSYSIKTPIEVVQPLVDAAADEGVYVVIDLQPGRQDFLTQAKLYEELLLLPHVGLALDPEWRLEPDERHLRQIGSVDAAEINATGDWLAELVRENNLPQKMFLLHQFRLDMIPDRDKVDTTRPELEVVVQMDGQGSQGSKLGTWSVLLKDAQEGLYFGWKNFYDEDTPQVLSPEKTIEIEPSPVFVSYQ